MYFVPDYQLNILSDSEFSTKIQDITAQLDQHRNSGYFNSFDGEKIFYEYFLAENSRASVVIVHGLSEFTKKYYEVTYYLLHLGYNVFLFDQRCHGLSCRLTDQVDLLHVDRFTDYAKDLEEYINRIVLPADSKPVYLYAHSMGGAVCAMYLATHPDVVTKAVLSAPLFDPQIGKVPYWIARPAIFAVTVLLGAKAKSSRSREFNPEYPFSKSSDESFARFTHNMDMRRANVNYQSTPTSNGWVNGSLHLRTDILNNRVAGRIRTPILLISAQEDATVKNWAHARFAQLCPSCKLITLKNAKHAMLTGTPEIIAEHLKLVFDFFGAEEVST